MTYRSPLSVAGPGQGQGTREAGGEGLRAGCAKAGSSSRPAWVGQRRGGACSLPQPPRPHPWACRRRGIPAGGTGVVPPGHDLRFAQREAAFPLKDHLWVSPKPKRLRGEGEGEPGSRALLSCRSRAHRGGGQRSGICGPWAGLLVHPGPGREFGQTGLALKQDPRMVFQLRGGRQDKQGSSQLHFPRMSPRDRQHMPMILINIFFT